MIVLIDGGEMEVAVDIVNEEITEAKIEVKEVEIGPVQNVKIPTLHSETNVIAVKQIGPKEVKVEIIEAEMGGVVGIVNEKITGVKTEVIEVEIGPVQNVRIQTLHSETNVIAVKQKNLKEVKVIILVEEGKEIIEGHKEKGGVECSAVEIQIATPEVEVLEVQINPEEGDFVEQVVAPVEKTDQVEVAVGDDFIYSKSLILLEDS
tara:strand:+ start:4729 stop:5346 length:618 start_codon:yes stop_codon:yes gene_type:complete